MVIVKEFVISLVSIQCYSTTVCLGLPTPVPYVTGFVTNENEL